MMRSLAFLMMAFGVLAFESPLLHRVHVAPYAPDFALVIVLYVGLSFSYVQGLFIVLCIGLMKDAFSLSVPVGLYMESLVIAFILAQRLTRRLSVQGPLGVATMVLIFSIGCSLLEAALSLVFDESFSVNRGGTGVALAAMLPQALMTAPFGPVGFWLMDRLDALVSQQREYSPP